MYQERENSVFVGRIFDGNFGVSRGFCVLVSDRHCTQESSPSFCICRCPEKDGDLLLLFLWGTVFCYISHCGGSGIPLVFLAYAARWRMCRPHIYIRREAFVWLILLLSSRSLSM